MIPTRPLVNNVETMSNVPHILPAGGLVSFHGDGWVAGDGRLHRGGRRGRTRRRRGRTWHRCQDVIDAVGSGLPEGRTVKVFWGRKRRGHRNRTWTYPCPTRDSQLSAAEWVQRGSSSTTTRPAWSTPPTGSPGSLSIESCGQCSPCKLGSAEITQCLQRIETGTGTDQDLEIMRGWLPRTDGSRCYPATEERIAISSILRAFPEEFADHIEHHARSTVRTDAEAR